MMRFLTFFNKYSLIVEGGAAGHMSHVFEDMDLTFGELKEMLNAVFSGEVELTEKTDGQNISVTWKDGQIGLARNKATLADPMNIKQTASKFEGRGPIKDAFVNSMIDIEKALKTVDKETLNRWFRNGKAFLSIEVLYPPTKNVVDYGTRCLLQLHGMQEYDEKYNKVGEDKEVAKEIYKTLSANDALKQDIFTITGPQVLSINDLLKSKKTVKKLLDSIKRIEFKFDLTDKSTLGDYMVARWKDYLENKFKDIPEPALTALVNRFAKHDKTTNKTKLIKQLAEYGISKSSIEELISIEKSLNSQFIGILEEVIINAGAILLNNLKGYVTVNPNDTVNKLTADLEDAIKNLKSGDPDALTKAEKYLKKVEKIGLDNIAPAEGVVFKYKDKVYKLTGKFGAINQLLGVFKFGR